MAEAAVVHAQQKTTITREEVLALASALGEPLPLAKTRLDGLNRFWATEMPDRVRHLWRYSDPLVFMPGEAAAEWASREEIPRDDDQVLGPLVQLGPGTETVIRMSPELATSPITVEPLSGSHLAAEYLHRSVGTDFGLFESLNAAAWATGIAIRIPRGFQCPEPLRLVVDASSASTISRLVVVVEEGAAAAVVQRFCGGSTESIANHVAELFVHPGATLDHLLVGELSDDAAAHLTVRANVDRDARYRQSLISLGGKKVKADLGANLIGQGASSEIYGVAIGDKRREFDHHTVHRHAAEHTWSNIDFKTALTGRAKSAYTGLIRIEKSADFTEAYQESRNLLLSDRCHADSIPELEILTNEVRCTHGATSAPVDPEDLFYLQSRGIDRQTAARIIVHGFFGELFAKAPASLRDEIEQLVEQRLEHFQMGV